MGQHMWDLKVLYTPSTPLNPTYVGPYRIMELFPQGALLKDPRTGEQMSVHFANMRKLSMDEFITLLPTHFLWCPL